MQCPLDRKGRPTSPEPSRVAVVADSRLRAGSRNATAGSAVQCGRERERCLIVVDGDPYGNGVVTAAIAELVG